MADFPNREERPTPSGVASSGTGVRDIDRPRPPSTPTFFPTKTAYPTSGGLKTRLEARKAIRRELAAAGLSKEQIDYQLAKMKEQALLGSGKWHESWGDRYVKYKEPKRGLGITFVGAKEVTPRGDVGWTLTKDKYGFYTNVRRKYAGGDGVGEVSPYTEEAGYTKEQIERITSTLPAGGGGKIEIEPSMPEGYQAVATNIGYMVNEAGETVYDPEAYAKATGHTPGYYGFKGYGGETGQEPELPAGFADWAPEEQVKWQAEQGLVPQGSEPIPNGGYITPEAAEVIKSQTPELYDVLITQGYRAYLEAYLKLKGQGIKEFEDRLQRESPELYEAYKSGGVDAYNAAVKVLNAEYEAFQQKIASGELIQLPDGKYITKDDLEKQPEGVKQILQSKGFTGLMELGEGGWTYNGRIISSEEREQIIRDYEAKRDALIKAGEANPGLILGGYPKDSMYPTPKTLIRDTVKGLAFIAPPAKALLPEYTIKDVSAVEWGLAGVNIALIGVAFAPGALLGSITGKAVMGGLSATGVGLVGYETTRQWAKLSTPEKAMGVGGTLLYALPILAIPARGVKFGSFKIPIEIGRTPEGKIIKGEATTWKGLSLFDNPVIGRAEGKWVVGARNLTLPEARLILEGYKPEMMLDTKVFVNDDALQKAGFSKAQTDYLTLTLKDRNLFAGKQSPFLSEEVLFDPTARLDKDEITVFLEQIGRYRDKVDHVDLLYGSQTMKAQLSPELRAWRQTRDLDMHSTFNLDEAVAWTNETIGELNKLPGNRQYRVSPDSPIRIEKLVEGKWEHINDLKSEFIDPKLQGGDIPGSQLDVTGAYSYGRLVEEPAITIDYPGIGKVDIQRLSMTGVQKSDTILRVRQTEIGTAFRPPERGIASPGVPKDAADFYVILKTYEEGGVLKAGTADEWAAQWAKAMGYVEDEIPQLLPKLTKAMKEVSAETPSDLIGYRFYPSRGSVSPEAIPTITIHIPQSLAASVSGDLKSRITSPISPYDVASSIPSRYLPNISSVSSYSFVTPKGVSVTPSPFISPMPPPIPSPILSGIPSTSPVPIPTPSPMPLPSLVPSVVPSPSIEPPIEPPVEGKPPPLLPKGTEYQEQVSKIKPGTVSWIQGRPAGGAMYKVLPPPYRQEDLFTMRDIPPGYDDRGWSGEGSARQSLQVIGGDLADNVENLDLGWARINIRMEGGLPEITYVQDEEANVGERSQTIGMGEGQIPIEVWEKAKAQGITKEELVGKSTRDELGESRLVPQEEYLVKPEQKLVMTELLPEVVFPETTEPLVEKVTAGLGEPTASVVWVDSWRDIPAPNADSSLKAYHDPNTDTIYAITGVTTSAELEHEKYHSLKGHEDRPVDPRIFARDELEAHKYAYEKIGEPKHVLEKLRAVLNDLMINEYSVEPHEAMSILETELNRVTPPEEWKDDYWKLEQEFEGMYGKLKEGTLVPSSQLLLPSRKRLLGGENRLVESAVAMEESGESDNSKFPRKKPKNLKNWWESSYYENRQSAGRGIPERTYYGHRLLPPDLGGEL